MTFARYTLRPSLRSVLFTFLVHHNPFYLLSAICMLGACYALNSGLSPRTGDLMKLLALIGTLNAYEALLIGLGLYLIRRRTIIRDGRTLLLLEAVFLVDLTFLNAEAGSVSFAAGLGVQAVVLALAVCKVAVVMRVLCGRWPRAAFSYVVLQLAVLLLLPCAFKWFEHRGPVTAAHFYLAWWVVGALIGAYEVQARWFGGGHHPDMPPVAHTIRRLYTMLPLASLLVHLSLLHWVYRVAFTAGDLSPVMLGVTVALGRAAPLPNLATLRALLPVAAVWAALREPPLVGAVHLLDRLQVGPVLLTLFVAYLVYVYCFFLSRAAWLLIGAVAAGATCVFDLVPKTVMHWGMLAMGTAFAFLGVGAAVSLRQENHAPDDAPAGPALSD